MVNGTFPAAGQEEFFAGSKALFAAASSMPVSIIYMILR
jgi:hypothetical protein